LLGLPITETLPTAQEPIVTENAEVAQTEPTPNKDGEAQPETSAEGEQKHPADISLEEATTEEMRDKLLALEAQSAENLDGWQRAQADFQNYKRRTIRDLEQARSHTAASVLSRFFPVLDDLELALKSMPQIDDGDQWGEGVTMVYRKLMNLLESEDITPLDAEPGQQFDPRFHEAVSQDENPDFENGAITAVLRPGYQLGERVLRAAQVRVAK